MRFGSLFSGAGMLDYGLHLAGVDHAWFCEWDSSRRELLRQRWPGVPVLEDVREIGAGNLPAVDGIVGGFPCKGASNAGYRNGFDHPETVLWREMARIVGEVRPRYVVLENVANLLTIQKGLVWQEVIETLATLRFDVVWDCIPAASVGAPHLRDRVFAVACDASDVGHERPGHPRVGRDGLADAGSPVADAARDGEGRPGSPAGSDRERARAGADAPADADGWLAQPGRGPGPVRGEARSVEGEGDQRERGGDAAGDSREAAPDADRADGRGRGTRGRLPAPTGTGDTSHVRVEWGEYEPAVRRWEAIHGPAPAPLTRVRGVDDGDAKLQRVRARLDRQRLSALGDGVHVYVGHVVGNFVVELEARRLAGTSKERASGTYA